MNRYKFPEHSDIAGVYTEFLSSLNFFHAVRKKDIGSTNKPITYIDPYEPSMFIYAFFTFNTLYNIDWEASKENDYIDLTYLEKREQDSELARINAYIHFIFSNDQINLTYLFKETFQTVIKDYFEAKHLDSERDIIQWIKKIMNNFVHDSHRNNIREYVFSNYEVDKFKENLCDIIGGRRFISKESATQMVKLLYHVRCNIFHGAKTPTDFLDGYQEQRLALYAAILISINNMLFHVVNSQLKNKHE